MRYKNAIISLFSLSIVAVIFLLYFANISRKIEKENVVLKEKINFIQEQININEIEYSLYNSYEYLQKIQKIYFDSSKSEDLDKRMSFNVIKSKNIDNFFTVGTK